MRKVTEKDIQQLKEKIMNAESPIFFENKYGKFALVITEKGKEKFLNEGFIAIQVKELWNWIKDCKSFKDQKKIILEKSKALAEGFSVGNQVKEIFKGKITDLT